MSRIIQSATIDLNPLVLSRVTKSSKASLNLDERSTNHTEKLDANLDTNELSNLGGLHSSDKQGSEKTGTYNDDTIEINTTKQGNIEGMVSDQHYSAVAEQALVEKKALEAERKQLELEKQELHAEIESLKEESREEAKKSGYADGFKEGLLSVEKEHEDKMTDFDECISSIKQVFDKEVQGIEDICLELVFESIAKILGRELEKPEVITQIVKEVISKARETSCITLHVSRKDYDIIQENKQELESLVQGAKIDIVPDGRVMLGGCLLESPDGSLDGRLEMQIQRLKEVILNTKSSSKKVSK